MALIVHRDQLFFSNDDANPVGTLLEGIWTSFPETARTITRNRIYTDQKLSPLCEGMKRVVGKRVTILSKTEYEQLFAAHKADKNLQEIKITPPQHRPAPFQIPMHPLSHLEALELAQKFARESPSVEVGAVLLDENGLVVSYGWNDHFRNRTMHAEVMLVKNYLASNGLKKLPANLTLITTLQPCAMCAGYLFFYCEDISSFRIVFWKKDNGPLAKNTALSLNSSCF